MRGYHKPRLPPVRPPGTDPVLARAASDLERGVKRVLILLRAQGHEADHRMAFAILAASMGVIATSVDRVDEAKAVVLATIDAVRDGTLLSVETVNGP